MANVKLEWSQATFVDSFKIYRSDATMNPASMPAPLATGVANNYYFDTSIAVDQTYFYRVGAVRGEQELISSEVEVLASAPVVNDPYWANVGLLIFADATTFPSTNFVDSSSNNRSIYKNGGASIVSGSVTAPKFDNGSIMFDGNGDDYIGTLSSIGIGSGDFTVEAFVKIPTGTLNNVFDAYIFNLNSISIMPVNGDYSQFRVSAFGYGSFPFSTEVTHGTWMHLCLMRKSNVVYAFVDGVLKTSFGYTTALNSITTFGGGAVGGREFMGFMNSCRATVAARYAITGFTPPDSKFPTS